MKKLGTAVLLSAVLLVGFVAYHGVLLVDVQPADGPRIVAPVPLALARVGLVFVPDDVQRIEARPFRHYLPHVDRIVSQLRAAPDARLVEVVGGGGERVTVTKEGDALRLRALQGGDTVQVLVPFASAEAVVRAYDADAGHFRTSGLVAALRSAPRTELVRVAEGRQRVRIRRIF